MNPFTIEPPDSVDAVRMMRLFVDAMGDFPKLIGNNHTFLNGHRGCGKSMMLRYLQPDCQCLHLNQPLGEHPFVGAYVPMKLGALDVSEGRRLDSEHAENAINEHIMCAYFAACLFATVRKPEVNIGNSSPEDIAKLEALYNGLFTDLLRRSGATASRLPGDTSGDRRLAILAHMELVCSDLYLDATAYLRRYSLLQIGPYKGPLLRYFDFLLPLIRGLRQQLFMSKGPVYLLVDDADYLTFVQTQILNSWVAARTTADVCLKITTQFKYRTFRALSGLRIETPHDYSEVNISSVYTNNLRGTYRTRIEAIIQKRLDVAGISASPAQFFPPNKVQEAEIATIADEIRDNWESGRGRGYRASDDAIRYARPTYMARLAGSAKSSSTYQYAGLDQLVHISSGIIREFLEPAARMYANLEEKGTNAAITQIPPGIQNQVIREYSNEKLLFEFEKLQNDPDPVRERDHIEKLYVPSKKGVPKEQEGANTRFERLSNLINSLGGIFNAKLLSTDAERRIFSFALANQPTDEIRSVINLGLENGYFHNSSIGKKDGTGRARLYIMNRVFAPAFYLDPTGFAGYLHATNALLSEAMRNPNALLRRIRTERLKQGRLAAPGAEVDQMILDFQETEPEHEQPDAV